MVDDSFRYTIPKYVPELSRAANVALASGSLASRLVREQRTRTVHPDGRRENVSEHSHMLAKVADALAGAMYPALDRGKIVLYAISHDDVEAYVGDTPTDRISDADRRLKQQREARGLQRLVHEFSSLSSEYAATAAAYERQTDPEARFVRIVDKMMVLLIHIPDNGATLKENYTFSELVAANITTANRLYDEYPEYGALVNLRTELAMYLARTYLLA